MFHMYVYYIYQRLLSIESVEIKLQSFSLKRKITGPRAEKRFTPRFDFSFFSVWSIEKFFSPRHHNTKGSADIFWNVCMRLYIQYVCIFFRFIWLYLTKLTWNVIHSNIYRNSFEITYLDVIIIMNAFTFTYLLGFTVSMRIRIVLSDVKLLLANKPSRFTHEKPHIYLYIFPKIIFHLNKNDDDDDNNKVYI